MARKLTAVTVQPGSVRVELLYPAHVETEWRLKMPALGMKADVDNSPAACIKLKCLSCAHGEAEVAACRVHICPLWPVRPYQDPDNIRSVGAVPSEEEYRLMREAKYPKAATGAGAAALADYRARKKAAKAEGDEE